jgi:hypothetical protein
MGASIKPLENVMKVGKRLEDLAAEIARQSDVMRDFMVPTQRMKLDPDLNLTFGENQFPVQDLAHTQIAERTGIPGAYYKRMREQNPELLCENVNTWWREQPSKRLVRTLDGQTRAFLTDSYRCLDNVGLAEAVLPVIQELNLQIVSAEITARRLYIKAVDKSIERDIPKGMMLGDGGHTFFDTVSPALSISNSEVGLGALSVEVGTLTKMCTNLAWMAGKGMRKYHIGKSEAGEEIQRLLSDETRKQNDKAVFMVMRDVVKNAFDEAKFDSLVDEIKGSTTRKIEGDPAAVVELVGERFAMTKDSRSSVLRHLIEGGSLSQYGLANAITRAAEDEANYDTATDFEKAGGAIMVLPANDWQEYAKAA